MLLSVSFCVSRRTCLFLEKCKYRRNLQNILANNWKDTGSSRTVCDAFYICSAKSSLTTITLPCVSLFKHTGISGIWPGEMTTEFTVKPKRGSLVHIAWVIWDTLQTIFRFIQLSCIFIPLFLIYPVFCISNYSKNVWYRCLLLGIEFSGPIIIKLGQWASTRRDLFTEPFCTYLSKLQRNTRPHSWYYTRKSLERAFGLCWQEIFVDIENDGFPIGSGCCAQVYKAWIKKNNVPASVHGRDVDHRSVNSFMVEALEMFGIGKFCGHFKKSKHEYDTGQLIPVAVKVLHPQMEARLRQDLFILKALASSVTWLVPGLKWLSLRECMDEFAKSMEGQVNFINEAANLELFARNFRDYKTVKFPQPCWSLTRSYVLVETFEEGRLIEMYMGPQESQNIKKHLADVGVTTILKMVFEDNFIHGDLHPGNMLVQDHRTSLSSERSKVSNWFTRAEPLSLVLFDCGIVSTLDARGRTCLRDVFAAVAQVDGDKVADLFLQHSNHQCTDIESFRKKMKEIVTQAMSKSVTLQQVDVSLLLNSLFSTMISHRVKVDSSFSSVILAIMVVEGLGRSLDPTIDVIAKAKPFLFPESDYEIVMF